jgi:SAM-dependent methyltransferase
MASLEVERDQALHILRTISRTRAYRLLRRLGRWQAIGIPAPGDTATAAVSVHELFLREGIWSNDLPAQPISAYRTAIDAFNNSQPNKELLDSIRSYNHYMLDQMNSIHPLRGRSILDIGASPHGYALERSLDHGAALYVGISLDISTPRSIAGDNGQIGLLLNMDAASLQFSSQIFDLVISMSTFEHFSDVDAVLSEIARVLKPAGLALISFEPIWSCSYGHHLHHFGECAKLMPPWAHLMWTPVQMRESLAEKWPAAAPLSLEQAIEWVFAGHVLNRLNIRQFKASFANCPLEVDWMIDLKEEGIDQTALERASAMTGLSCDELTTKGLSVLLVKKATPGLDPRLRR